MKNTLKAVCFSAVVIAGSVQADDEYNHFPSLPAPDLKTALCNLQSYNEKLSDITSKSDLAAVDMVKVHELTYTLENAIARMQETLVTIAEDLEEVHLASERLDHDAIGEFGSKYLQGTEVLLATNTCS